MNTRLPSVLSATDLPLAELHAARLDGELVAVADFFSPIDQPDDIQHRAHVLAGMTPHRMIAEKHSAAWVWGVSSDPPRRQQFCVDIDARVCISAAASHRLREVVIDDSEIADIGDLRLTTPLRTAIDIARAGESFHESDRDVIAALMAFGGFSADDCLSTMNRRRNLPRKAEAMERIRDAGRTSLR